jgi:hypothetical protein
MNRSIYSRTDRNLCSRCVFIRTKEKGGHMAVYGPVRHQKNITWTSEDSVRILPYDLQCHELFSIYSYVGFKRSLELVLFRRAIEISLYITNFHNKGIMSLILFIFNCPDIFYWEINTNYRVFKSKVQPFSYVFMNTHLEHQFLSVRLYMLRFI